MSRRHFQVDYSPVRRFHCRPTFGLLGGLLLLGDLVEDLVLLLHHVRVVRRRQRRPVVRQQRVAHRSRLRPDGDRAGRGPVGGPESKDGTVKLTG